MLLKRNTSILGSWEPFLNTNKNCSKRCILSVPLFPFEVFGDPSWLPVVPGEVRPGSRKRTLAIVWTWMLSVVVVFSSFPYG